MVKPSLRKCARWGGALRKGLGVSRSIGLAHIIRQDDRTVTGVWGVYVLKSAFQPIFRFADGTLSIAAFEGLIRPFRDGEAVAPGNFFRSIPAGDRLHVETLTRTLHLLNAGEFLDPAAMLFVNFDPSVFSEREIAEKALREMRLTLHEAHIDPKRIVCEVTEQKSTSQQALSGFVQALRDHGFRIAVDDYGAEESDMERVAALSPDIVKFDAHWITRLMDSRPGFALLTVMVAEFRSRGITVVFEGIEETWQLEMAEEAGADMVQGFVLARPELAPTGFAVFARAETSESAQPVLPPDSPGGGVTAPGPSSRRGVASARPFGRRVR